MAMILAAIAQTICESISSGLRNLISYKSIVGNLSKEAKKLEAQKYNLKHMVEQRMQGQDILLGLSRWFVTADRLLEEVTEFLRTSSDLSIFRLISRYKMGKTAVFMTWQVVELCEEANLISSATLSTRRGTDFLIFPSRSRLIEQAMEALKDDTISIVGICGKAGVGKTTVAKQIVEKVATYKLFREVAQVVVSREPDYSKIRGQIRDAILKPKTLVVLEDVWAEFDLELIGLASPGSPEGYKILLTSQSQQVCRNMGSAHNLVVEPLLQEEASNLFWNKVGTDKTRRIENLEKQFIQDQILAECNGLPMALVLAAAQLARGEKLPWNDALKQLSRAKSSYAKLQSEKAKVLFLLCCIFKSGQDIPIESLVRFSTCLGVFNSDLSIREARIQAHSLVDNLKSSSLLSDGKNKECVKINVARELATRVVAEKDDYGLVDTVKWYQQQPSSFEGLQQPKFLDLSIASSIESLAGLVEFNPNLHTLSLSYCQLQGKDLSCIGALEQLQILSFAHSDVEELTCEIKLPSTLRLLDLTKCKHLKRISSGVLAGLPSLEELYTLGTAVEWEIHDKTKPASNASLSELANSPRLTSLTVHAPSADHLPEGLLLGKGLTRFQIFIGDFSCPWDEHLHGFTNRLSLCIPPEAHANANAQRSIQPEVSSSEIKPVESGALVQPASALMQLFRATKSEVSLLQNLRSLEFHGCNDLAYLFSAATARQFVKLQTLKIMNCKMIAKVIDNADEKGGDMKFPELRTLVLKNLPRLERFCASDESCSFEWPLLETVRVKGLPMMKIFAPGSHSTPRLRAVHVTFLDKRWKDNLNATFEHIHSSSHQANGVDGQGASSSHGAATS